MERIEEYLCLVQQMLGEGFWSVIGAIIGAFLGALFGFVVTIFLSYQRNSKLQKAFYSEAIFLASNMSPFLKSVVHEYEKQKIDIINGDSYSGPREIDFSVFNTLHLELYKTNLVPTDDHRRFIHNVRSLWEKVCLADVNRVNRYEGTKFHSVDQPKCMEIVHDTVNLLYYFDLFVSKKEEFKFDENIKFNKKASVVFSKHQIKNDVLIDEISKQTDNW